MDGNSFWYRRRLQNVWMGPPKASWGEGLPECEKEERLEAGVGTMRWEEPNPLHTRVGPGRRGPHTGSPCLLVLSCPSGDLHLNLCFSHHTLSLNLTPNCSVASLFFFFFLLMTAPVAYESSQARGQIRAVAAGLCHSYSNTGSEPPLRPVRQLAATVDP